MVVEVLGTPGRIDERSPSTPHGFSLFGVVAPLVIFPAPGSLVGGVVRWCVAEKGRLIISLRHSGWFDGGGSISIGIQTLEDLIRTDDDRQKIFIHIVVVVPH